ncbi:P-loop NTPase fold protein [Pseudomonas sp. LP_4_YM]|uniref:P-loop NTPase fold protein n=1 Tax=Pseudomonas sp. LP_4_YM TaxID=2485135 RepID=UPI0010466A67|nr:P-loop NTPase fold protein [Pseudomonas sp. LP_4_YM]TCT86698.1 KAP-like P-loop domain-containing protein [Pseudomonas sp. LP_4_YM]
MTIERCKHNLLLTLASQDNRVIALTGKWGTGKTHLWQQVRDTSVDETIKQAAAISLFGVSSVNDLKTKVAYALMPRLVDKGVATQITEAFEGLTKLAKGLHRSFNAMDNLPLVILPTLFKNKFLVIDDIERKHASCTLTKFSVSLMSASKFTNVGYCSCSTMIS